MVGDQHRRRGVRVGGERGEAADEVLARAQVQAGGGSGEVFLQSASAAGPDPFTRSTARTGAAQSPAPLPSPTGQTGANVTRTVAGSAEGLYGGTKNVASCDVEQQVRFLGAEPDKNRAFASVLGIDQFLAFFGIPSFITPFIGVPLPEIALYKSVRNRSHTEIQIYAFDGPTGAFTDKLPTATGKARYDDYTILILISFSSTDLDKSPDQVDQ